MNWGQNKFLIGLSGVVLIGSLSLGFFVWRAAGTLDAQSELYGKSEGELKHLQSLPLYPEPANLKKLEEQKIAVNDAAAALQQELTPLAFPLAEITPEQFQDKLRATVSAITEKANAAEVKLPDKFYLGFEQYQSGPPKSEAASVLDRELKAIELTVETLISNGATAITSITRAPLPEEGEVRAPVVVKAPAKTPAKAGPPAAPHPPALLSKYPFEIGFIAEQTGFRRALNALAKNGKQFFILEPLSIKTENDKPISKAAVAQAAPAPVPIDGALPQRDLKDGSQLLHYLVGTEKVTVALRLEMVIFASSSPQ